MATVQELISRDVAQEQNVNAAMNINSVDPLLLQLMEQDETESETNPVKASLESGEWTNKDSLMGASLFIEGMTLGWSDEMITGVVSAAESLASDEDYSSIYKKNKASYEAETAAFKERQPTAALAAEIAGSVVSPLAKIKTASTLTGLALRGATEGGIYAVGSASQDKTTGQLAVEAAKGTAIGGGSGAVIGSFGWLLKRKVAEPLLTEGGEFTPITIAASSKATPTEAFVHSLYRDIIGPSYGGKGVIRAQEEASKKVITLKSTIEKSNDEVTEASRALNNALDSLESSKTTATKKIRDDLVLEKAIINGDYKPLLGTKGLLVNKAAAKIKEGIDNNNDAFRIQAFNESLPVNVSKKEIKNILEAPNPNAAMERLEKAWSKEGFKSTKNRSYRLKTSDLVEKINAEINDDTKLQLLAQNKSEVTRIINNALDVMSTKINPKTGVIQGKDFTDIRSSLGSVAAEATDTSSEGVLKSMLFRKVQKVLDDKMESQLTGDAQKAFQKDRAAWKTHVILKDAVQSASGKAGVNGKFTADDWVSAIKRGSKAEARQGRGPLRNQAETIARINDANKIKINKAAERLQNWAEKTRESAIQQANLRSNSQLAKLDNETRVLKSRMRVDRTAPDKLADVARRKVEAEQTLAMSQEALAEMEKARTPASPGWFHSYAATGTLGALFGGVASAATATAAGLGAGKTLASPTVQQAIAGQLPVQTAVQRAVASPRGSQALGMVPAAPRAVVGMLTGEPARQPQ